MPLFISEEELERCSEDGRVVAAKADAYIKNLHTELETVKAEADAASITAEQTCSLLEQKYVSLSSEFSSLQSNYSQLSSSLQQRDSELAQLQADKHQIHLQSIGKDGEFERLSMEASELHKSKRELMELLERKDSEITEKKSTINAYLDKIVKLTDAAALREARLSELESELARNQASCARVSQEKELVERHNAWLNDELTAKVDSLIELRRKNGELEAEMSARLADVEKKFSESCSSSNWNKERVKELESKLASLEEELLSSKDAAAATEEHSRAEISTVTKLVDLYKESSEEWSKKAGELEGVVKALETHLKQFESDYKERLEKELSTRKEIEKEAACLKEKLETCEMELERSRKENELKTLPLSLTSELDLSLVRANGTGEDDRMLVPSYPTGVSGTALAASLLRDGWSLAKMYANYQEAIDAMRHEQLGRKQTQAILERVLYEIEEKAGVILDERAEHEKLVEAYSMLNEKLQNSFSEQSALERTIQELKADLRRRERDNAVAQTQINDLQKQVTVLVKECRDIQVRCGSAGDERGNEIISDAAVSLYADSGPDNIQLLTFKDINGLVEQNVQLRSLVRCLSDEIESKEIELKEKYEQELQKHTDEAVSRVNAVLARAEEQGHMIESLHSSVAMYRKLYEEEHKLRASYSRPQEQATDDGRKDIMVLLEDSHEVSKKAQQQASERAKCLEEDMAKLRGEIGSIRSERDRLALEAQFAQEKLGRFMKEFEHQRDEHNGVLARNVEFSQLIVEYQRKVRESSESLNAAEELSRKLSMEVSVLKNEKELLLNAEKRACDEVRSLSERVYRLQASLDTIQSSKEVHEDARIMERKKQDEYIKQIEREWAEAKKELQVERENVRNLTIERQNTMKDALKQVEEMARELTNASRAVSVAEARASVAEARCADLEKLRVSENKVLGKDDEVSPSSSGDKYSLDLRTAKEELERLREEAQANKNHMLQYKSIAEVNEAALKQMESAHESYKVEMERIKTLLEEELQSLRGRVKELESECNLKTKEVASATADKEEALAAVLSEMTSLREAESVKQSQFATMEIQIAALKDDLEKEHQKWQAAQANYERQVILQSETIQELTKTSKALSTLQEEASDLRKLVHTLTSENNELKAKWDVEKSALEASKNEAERRYSEVNELNTVLHSQLEALHIKSAEKDRHSAGSTSGSAQKSSLNDDGLQSVVNYLRRSKEIAETEISLLKQEKLRLQSQLEGALKAAESAQASLHADRANARSCLFTEEEFKSLQLQVREINLLRESNAQLREENRHNFEECQKLREAAQKTKIDAENVEKLLKETQNELEACRKEIEMQKIENEQIKKRTDELLETFKNIDVDEYHRSREANQQMQVNLNEKDAQLEETRKLVSEKHDVISRLEQDLERSRVELKERETRINEMLQVEASLKLDLEKRRRYTVELKRKLEREKEELNKEMQRKSEKEKEDLNKEMQRKSEKEKEDLNKEIQGLSKQLEDARQAKRNLADVANNQAIREKDKEKDTRIQMLEKTVERQREQLKKLKNAKGSQSEVASEVQLSSGPLLEEPTGVNLLAVENIERVAQPMISELGTHSAADSSSAQDTSSSGVTMDQAVLTIAPSTTSAVAPISSIPAGKTVEEKEKSSTVLKTNIDTRKAARKLVRPRIQKGEEPQSDIEMPDIDGSNNSGKPSSAPISEPQGNVTSTMPPAARKRPSSSSASESLEDLLTPEETSSDIAEPLPKRAKGLETQQEGEGQEVSNLEVLESSPTPEDSLDDVADIPVDANKKEAEVAGNLQEEMPIPGKDQVESQDDKAGVADKSPDRPSEPIGSEDQSNVNAEPEIQQEGRESGSDLEEGEMMADVADSEGGDNVSNAIGSPEAGELPPEDANDAGGDEEPIIPSTVDVKEVESSQVLDDEKNGETVPIENVDGKGKVNDVTEQVAAEPDHVTEPSAAASAVTSTSSTGVAAVPRQRSVTPDREARQLSPPGTTINLTERARERARERQAGIVSTSTTRGRGRTTRGRLSRATRGRGQPPSG